WMPDKIRMAGDMFNYPFPIFNYQFPTAFQASCLKINVTGGGVWGGRKRNRCLTGKCYPKTEAMKMKTISREEQLERWRHRYKNRGIQGKAQLLDQLCQDYGYHRKHAIRLLNSTSGIKKSPPGPESKYEGLVEVVQRIWTAAEQPCGKRLAEALPLWLPHYQRHYGRLLPSQRQLADQVSAATLDRLLQPARAQTPWRGLGGAKPGTLLRQQIPIQGEVWNEKRAGFLEADSVAHCGSSLAGNFIWSLTFTDLASAWTSGRVVWNKGAAGVLEQTRQVEEQLPFALLGLDFDNGTEWLNWGALEAPARCAANGLSASAQAGRADQAKAAANARAV
ncbi:MAG: hypothetical protein ABR924_16070, partial [Terracidiphilus sp.]